MGQIQVSANISVHSGKQGEFKQLARRFLEIVSEKEKGGTLQYDWFLSEDGTTCSVRETYADSEAVLAHLANVGRLFGQLATMSTFEFEVFGTPSDELKAATKDLTIKTYAYFQGLES